MSQTTLALHGGPKAVTIKPPRYPHFSDEALARLSEALRSGKPQGLSKHHPVVEAFETRLANFHGVDMCLAASSGHGALQSALIGLEITGGDEVITSPYSWGASVSCILHNGAVPVFVDVDPLTGLINPEGLDEGLSDRTRAVLVPHLFGQPADMTAIMQFAERHNLMVIEDGSQAHGARHRGRRIGSFGHASGFSINGVKPLATTEGGYMVTRVPNAYWNSTISTQHAGRSELVGRASEHGFPVELHDYIDSLVYTYRPNVTSMILALDQLGQVDELNEVRSRNAHRLMSALADSELFEFPTYDQDDTPVFHMVTMNVRSGRGARDRILKAVLAEGVPAVTYVEKGLHLSPRLSPHWSGPRVMWTEAIRASGIDPTKTALPGSDEKVASSIEIPWNYIEDSEELVEEIATAFRKAEQHLASI